MEQLAKHRRSTLPESLRGILEAMHGTSKVAKRHLPLETPDFGLAFGLSDANAHLVR